LSSKKKSKIEKRRVGTNVLLSVKNAALSGNNLLLFKNILKV
jgi:hypothetical protein